MIAFTLISLLLSLKQATPIARNLPPFPPTRYVKSSLIGQKLISRYFMAISWTRPGSSRDYHCSVGAESWLYRCSVGSLAGVRIGYSLALSQPFIGSVVFQRIIKFLAGHGSLIGSMFAWHASSPYLIPMSGTFFCGDLGMKKFLQPFSLFRWFKKSSCQLLAKECALSIGKLPRRLAQEQCD